MILNFLKRDSDTREKGVVEKRDFLKLSEESWELKYRVLVMFYCNL